MLLEVCANSLTSALNAQKGGAHRIELCDNLAVGGVTPSPETMRVVKARLDLPVYVLIRPRAGDFVYSATEAQTMIEQIKLVADMGFPGVVIGALTTRNRIDEVLTYKLMQAAGFMDVTFHRAFDEVEDHFEALDCLKELGIQRVLTSGGASTAMDGYGLLSELIEEADDEVIIMPGGSIRPANFEELITLGAKEYHSACIPAGEEFTSELMVKEMISRIE